MDDRATHRRLHVCSSCGSLGVGGDAMTCCDRPMRAVRGDESPVDPPSLDGLLRSVFDMSETELDVCLCVMEGGELTVADLAERIDYDRSVVSRHLAHLVDLGVLERERRLLEAGGQVYVYTPSEPDVVRRRLTAAFVEWAGQATELVDSLGREKVEAMVETDVDGPQWKLYRE